MAWADIMLDDRKQLHVFKSGPLTALKYRDGIFEPDVLLFRVAGHVADARLHWVHLVDDFVQTEDIFQIEWPASSPELNPKDLILDSREREFETRNITP